MQKLASTLLLVIWLLLALNNKCFAQQKNNVLDTTIGLEYTAEDSVATTEAKQGAVTEAGEIIEPILRKLPADSMIAIKQLEGFEYMAYIDSVLKKWEEAKKKTVKQEEPTIKTTHLPNTDWLKPVVWIVAIGVVLYVLYLIFAGSGSPFAPNKKIGITQVDIDEKTEEEQLDVLVSKAINKSNYRLATRYLFLQTLQLLQKKGLIQMAIDKTNHQYATELLQSKHGKAFAEISLNYEFVWFGNFELNATQFEPIQAQYTALKKAL